MAAQCIEASPEGSGHPSVAACSVSRGLSAAAFTRDLLGLSRLWWCFRHTISSKRALRQLSRVLSSALPENQFSMLMKARRYICSHSWVVLAFFTTPCSMSTWYTLTPVSPLSYKSEDVSPPDGTSATKPWLRKGDGLRAPSEGFPSPHRTFEHKYCSGGCTAPRCWRFSRTWQFSCPFTV